MIPDPVGIDAIIFDLGGVLYGIDPPRTVAALAALAGPRARLLAPHDPLFERLDLGHVDAHAFRGELRSALDTTADDAALDAAWNALLLGPIAGREEQVRALAAHYRIALLSNTNAIHAEVWGPQCAPIFAHMEQTFFSFELGLRKPDAAIYRHALDRMGLDASRTLFVDDLPANVAGAQRLGMHTLLIDPHDPAQFSAFCLEFLSKV